MLRPLDPSMGPPTPRQPSRRRRVLVLAGLVAAALLWVRSTDAPSASVQDDLLDTSGTPTFVEGIGGYEVLLELPAKGKPKGVLLALHGCSHAAGDFWPKSSACEHCLGLPEELRIRAITLRRRLAFVALSSLDRHTGCWDAEGDAGLAAAVAELLAAHGLSGKPLYVFGASSGGAMALLLPRHAAALPAPLPVSGVVSEIMAVGLEYLDKLPGGGAYPPTAFVHMPRDADTAARVAEAVGALSEAGTPVAEVQIKPRAVTPEFLAGRSAALRKRGGAARVVRALLKGDMLDGHGYQQRDPRGGQWRAVVHEAVTSVATAADSSDLSELLNLAYARHEIVSDHIDQVLAWLEAGGDDALLPDAAVVTR